jgi:hypothetical protein
MNRSRRWSVIGALAALIACIGRGQLLPVVRADQKTQEVKWMLDRTLTVSPASVPIPALKYRLFPLSSTRKDGNAVPIYLRLNFEQTDASRKYWHEQPEKWNKLTLDKIPLKEANEFIRKYRNFYRQFDLGARRKAAEWDYTLDQGSFVDILLPDVQQMHHLFVPMMVLKARVEIAEGDYSAALRTLETGFSFSQQISEAPFLISALIGMACASRFEEVLPDLIERPDAPNLYWALTAMPRPIIDLRKATEMEQRFVELQFPELAKIDRLRTDEQWDALLAAFRKEFQRLTREERNAKAPRVGTAPEDPAAKSPDLPVAKKYLTERLGIKASEVDAMPAARILLLWIVSYSREVFDDQFKSAYLPYPHTRPAMEAAEKRLMAAPDTEAQRLAGGLVPALTAVTAAQVRVDRKLAALRVIEALRLYAANNGGQLPDRLDQITEVPVPDDPGTGKPFEYASDGRTATLTGRLPDEPQRPTSLRYKVTVRK